MISQKAMEEYQKDAVDYAIKKTWEDATQALADNLRKQNPSLSLQIARGC